VFLTVNSNWASISYNSSRIGQAAARDAGMGARLAPGSLSGCVDFRLPPGRAYPACQSSVREPLYISESVIVSVQTGQVSVLRQLPRRSSTNPPRHARVYAAHVIAAENRLPVWVIAIRML
jgi:hypothetical protein